MSNSSFGKTIIILFMIAFPIEPGRTLRAAELRIETDANIVTNTMRGGIGASWYAIGDLTAVKNHGGSAWGGNPPPGDEAAWSQIMRHADWLGMDWYRVELSQRMYEPERGQFDWDNAEMRNLYRILDWCQRRKADVFLQQMWANVAWNAFPQWRDDPVLRLQSGPASMEDFAQGLATLAEHLVRRKGYTCIRWLGIVNEPNGRRPFAWWLEPPGEPMSITRGLAAVRKALDAKGLNLPLAAPDWSCLPELDPKVIDFDPFTGAYDIHVHSYGPDHNRYKGNYAYSLSVAQKRLADWADWAHARGKPLFLAELGTVAFGWQNSNPGPSSYEAAMQDAGLVVRGLRVGVDAFGRWSFNNRGDLDGQWQMIETWDRKAKQPLKQITPKPNPYFVYGLLSRFTAKNSDVLKCDVTTDRLGKSHPPVAAALRSPKGQFTLLVVNDSQSEWETEFTLHGTRQVARLYRYQMTSRQRDRIVKIQPNATFPLQGEVKTFHDCIPATSVSVYTTYNLTIKEPGVIAE